MQSSVTGRACCMLCHLDNPMYLLTIDGECYCNVTASNARATCAVLRLQRSVDEMRTPSVVLPATCRAAKRIFSYFPYFIFMYFGFRYIDASHCKY